MFIKYFLDKTSNLSSSITNIINKSDNKSVKTSKTKKEKKVKAKKPVVLKKKNKLLRKAGGEVWEDPTLDEWPENDYRLFCGDLGNEVTDEVLSNGFRKYNSFLKARVIRDKRTGKSKGKQLY